MSAELAIIPPRGTAEQARHLHPAALPRWRALLESHWQRRLELVTRLSLAFHDAEAAAGDLDRGQRERRAARRTAEWMLRRAVTERYALAEIEAALARLGNGRFGWCEACGAAIPTVLLAETPQARYCASCSAGIGPAPAIQGRAAIAPWPQARPTSPALTPAVNYRR